jgi:hypothetical protein
LKKGEKQEQGGGGERGRVPHQSFFEVSSDHVAHEVHLAEKVLRLRLAEFRWREREEKRKKREEEEEEEQVQKQH